MASRNLESGAQNGEPGSGLLAMAKTFEIDQHILHNRRRLENEARRGRRVAAPAAAPAQAAAGGNDGDAVGTTAEDVAEGAARPAGSNELEDVFGRAAINDPEDAVWLAANNPPADYGRPARKTESVGASRPAGGNNPVDAPRAAGYNDPEDAAGAAGNNTRREPVRPATRATVRPIAHNDPRDTANAAAGNVMWSAIVSPTASIEIDNPGHGAGRAHPDTFIVRRPGDVPSRGNYRGHGDAFRGRGRFMSFRAPGDSSRGHGRSEHGIREAAVFVRSRAAYRNGSEIILGPGPPFRGRGEAPFRRRGSGSSPRRGIPRAVGVNEPRMPVPQGQHVYSVMSQFGMMYIAEPVPRPPDQDQF